ncbi:unnamed protein product [Adineta steineri]|uniref:RRM domain-containing protein n=1 Tax=Adineta steineri TaxID=433720 RepID=A0A819HIP9_9BILA|nr:unnamed protein product [Adineta steineri]CAF1290796.1 unnamed protein product [Adineta steineri]CAF1386435.1 unnamed protein product [Adineta steineri]CAF3552952.1 unnamed protein product [Adineta steineri]CAF3897542.1 unnamed protein product [Adineta steineri]
MEEVDPTVIKHHQLSSLLNVSPVYSSFLIQDEQDNSQEQTQIDKSNELHNTTNENSFLTTFTELDFDKYLSEFSQMYEEQSSETDTSMEMLSMFNDIETLDEEFYSFENFMNTGDPIPYAFILHGTAEEAKHNFAQSIDYVRLGSGCRVKYAGDCSCLPDVHQSHDKQKVVVTNIPENVSDDDLRHLFPNSRVSSYCPARTVLRKTVPTKIPGKRKTLRGYAFLNYDNVQEAANVIENAGQYKINGRTLCVSFYSERSRV